MASAALGWYFPGQYPSETTLSTDTELPEKPKMLQWARYQEEVFTATGAVPTKCWWEVFCANGYLHKGDETKGLLRLSGISAVFTRYPQELWANSSWVNYHNHSSSYPTCNHKGIQSLPCLPLATCSTAGFCLAVTVPCPEMGLFLWHSKQFQ